MTHTMPPRLALTLLLGAALLVWLAPDLASASSSASAGMPWEGPLDKVVKSVTGPVAKAAGILSIFLFGMAVAFSEGGGLRVVLGIVFGLSIAFAAASWGVSFFGFAGGAVL